MALLVHDNGHIEEEFKCKPEIQSDLRFEIDVLYRKWNCYTSMSHWIHECDVIYLFIASS
jgi:hypothetical protein